MLRTLVIVPAFVLLAFCRAQAATEVCGAEPRMVVRVAPAVYGYVLAGEAPRTVTGHLDIYTGTERGYQIPFADVALRRTEHQYYRPDGAPYVKVVDYESAPLYFTLPQPKDVLDVWVDDSGFEGHPHAGCEISPFDLEYESNTFWATAKQSGGVSAADVVKAAPPNAPAVLDRGMPGSEQKCGRRFVPSRAVQPYHVQYPEEMRSSYEGPVDIISKVLVDRDGSVIDAWLLGGSPNAPFNIAGLRAAEKTQYAPAEFLCRPVPFVNVFVNKFVM